MTAIHAELTADREHLVLVAGGEALPGPGGGPSSGRDGVVAAAKQLKLLTPLFSKSDPPGALITEATWAAVTQLVGTFGSSWYPGPALQDWVRQQVLARTSPTSPSYAPPAGLTPYPWQVEGAALIAATGRALITDEPGTGKTITAILGLVERGGVMSHHDSRTCPACSQGQDRAACRPASFRPDVAPALVVCPASVIDSWVAALRTWAPHVRAVAWRGTPAKRRSLAGTADVYVASYETVRQDAPTGGAKGARPLLELGIGHLVIDECHLIKNHQTHRSKAVRRLAHKIPATGTVVALSGTPITHHPGDLWAALDALDHAAWPARERWVTRYCQVIDLDYGQEILGLHPGTEPEFRLTLLGQHRRVAKADVLTQLPPKVYSVRTVELPREWRKAYDAMEAEMLAELPDGTELSVMSVLAQLTRLSQLASAPADVATTSRLDEQTGELVDAVTVTLRAPSWKVDALLEVLEERPGSPVVTFAPSRQLMTLAGEAAAAAGYRVGYVVGGQTAAQRTEAVEAFQAGQLDLICATTGAGGVGLTLTAARTVVFLQRPWSLVEALQAEDRCHRIGSEQHDSIEVIDIVAKNTVDDRVRAVLRERAGQLSDLVQDARIVTELLGGAGTTYTPGKKVPA